MRCVNGKDSYCHLTFEKKIFEYEGSIIWKTPDETDTIINIPDGYGQVHIVNEEEEGIYYSAAFNVKGGKKFTIRMCSPE